jgi:hypothetical protein
MVALARIAGRSWQKEAAAVCVAPPWTNGIVAAGMQRLEVWRFASAESAVDVGKPDGTAPELRDCG